MKDLTEAVFASNNEEEAAAVRDCLTANNIKCTLKINTNNQMFGRGVLNDGNIISGGSFEIMVDEKDIKNALKILSENEEEIITEESITEEEKSDYSADEQDIIDKRFFVRAILLGFIHMLGFGTIAALISAWNISPSKRRMRLTAFAVPLCWYIFVIINLYLFRPELTAVLFLINIMVLISFILSPKKPAVTAAIFLSGLILLSTAVHFFF